MLSLEPLYTSRLQLRPSALQDAAWLWQLFSHPDVHHYLDWQAPRDAAATKRYLQHRIRDAKRGISQHWMIVSSQQHQYLGCIAVRYGVDANADIGCLLSPVVWGQGYASEAVSLLCNKLQQQWIPRWQVQIANSRSIMLAKRLGFVKTAQTQEHFVYHKFCDNISK